MPGTGDELEKGVIVGMVGGERKGARTVEFYRRFLNATLVLTVILTESVGDRGRVTRNKR